MNQQSPKTNKYVDKKNCTFRWCWLNVHFAILLTVAICYGPVFFWAANNFADEGSLFALVVSMLILFTLISRFFIVQQKYFLLNDLLLCTAFGLSIPAFFFAVGPVVLSQGFSMWDPYFLDLDRQLLGWLCEEGQIALWLDKSAALNPQTFVGKLIVEILQISYSSYYLWGYLTLLILMYRYARAYLRGDDTDLKMVQLKMFICGWMFTYYINFLINLSFPAKSPRIFIKEKYSHSLEGFGLAGHLRTASSDDSTFGTFPSGHVGESFVVAFYGLRLFGGLGKLSTFFAVLITFATIFLRYHYFVDVLGAIPVILLGLLFGLFIPSERYNKYIEKAKTGYENLNGFLGLDVEKGLTDIDIFGK